MFKGHSRRSIEREETSGRKKKKKKKKNQQGRNAHYEAVLKEKEKGGSDLRVLV